ncbi:MAG TPA: hypothetical protein VHO47_02385 [Candidatus Babeliales bacterium]|nr:hypothetical protein [Candidatus Babeliales bacterium]
MLKLFLLLNLLFVSHFTYTMNHNSGKYTFIGTIPAGAMVKSEQKSLISKQNTNLNENHSNDENDHTRNVFGYWGIFSCCFNIPQENE